MKSLWLIIALLLTTSCTQRQVEELAFRKTLEYDLIDLCGEEDKECIAAVKSQVKGCMEKSNWRKYLENQDSESELKRFKYEFYSCIVDSDGNPLFVPDV